MSNHSPTPWTVSDIHQGPYVVCAGSYAIAQMVRMPGEFDAERLANAHLMAAAPDLLAALRDWFDSSAYLINIANDGLIARSIQNEAVERLVRCRQATRDAIAKATGEVLPPKAKATGAS